MENNLKIGVVSLGCDKNRVDTENMLAYMQEDGYTFTGEPQLADIIIVNTCGFIDSAKQESIESILEMADYKKGKCKYLIVSGCLSQRYMDDLEQDLQEVDAFIGTTNYHNLPKIIEELQQGNAQRVYKNDKNDRHFTKKRILTTPVHYAYLKIAEGCDNKCTYCAIPAIRGKFTSRPIEDIVEEAKNLLATNPITEFVLVAQDVSNYGKDLYGQVRLIELIKELSKLNVQWIRLLYLYPENITNELLDYIDSNSKVCKYLDIPCQHISDRILKLMNRHVRKADIIKLFENIRARGDYAIRSTFIVGFPQENEEDYQELVEFIKQAKIDRCGFFAYSCEENTPASRLSGQIDEDVKTQRLENLYAVQEAIMQKKQASRIGTIVDVVYEGIDYDRQLFEGRTVMDAPQIDAKIYFKASNPIDIGQIYKVKITAVDGIDSIGEIL